MLITNKTATFLTQNINGYQIIEQLYSGTRTLVYRGIFLGQQNHPSLQAQQPVVLKVLRNEYPNFNELLQFQNQYSITKNLDLPGVIKTYDLESYNYGYCLVLEDFGGMSLWEFVQKKPLDIETFLKIAIQLAEILHELCQNRIIHKDIKPANVLIHPETQEVKLIDFSISSLLSRETQEIQNPNILEGTLAYIAPEQTGRMNRGIDYRTDFYSLGVTLYELLTGQLPFQSQDPMELVHCHIAKVPTFPNTPGSEGSRTAHPIPNTLKEIVIKLMAKNAEDRYQSALGLKSDLEKCLTVLKETGKIPKFQLGKQDISERFIIPEKLYGRELEVAQLLAAFDRVSSDLSSLSHQTSKKINKEHSRSALPCNVIKTDKQQSEMMLVAGFSGIGKTAIINEVHKPIVRQKGYFIKGKFDQFNRNIPFSAFVQAFQDLINQLLGESDQKLANWKAKILEAVGENGQVIIDVIPELESIIGQQPNVPKLSGSAAQNRFNLVFGKFVKVFSSKDHPLVIFLDDLQWVDSASLNLLQLIMNESTIGYLLILGAYRDNEVFPGHPLILTLEEIRKQKATIHTLNLKPLAEVDITQLIADTLLCSLEVAAPLSQLVNQKTQGNPFFTNQFLKGLYEENCITFNKKIGYWQCDLTQIRQLTLTDNVVEFMVTRLQKLPKPTQDVLKLAACIGNRFDLATLAIICEKPQEEVATLLWKALQEGFIVPENETYKFFQIETTKEKDIQNITVNYRFLHDRVQQASYSLIPEKQKQKTHYNIGKLLLQKISPDIIEEQIFEIVNQFNQGTNLIKEQTEKDHLAKLNLIACRKARTATAYNAGFEYAQRGLSLLSEKAWQNQYSITLELYELAADLAFLCGDFEEMEQLINTVLEQANSLLEKIQVYCIRIQASICQRQLTQAIAITQNLLQQLDITSPITPTQEEIQQSFTEVNKLISNRNIEDLLNLPMMTDRKKIAIVQIIDTVIPATSICGSPLLYFLVALSVKLSIEFGNTESSILTYACYGIIACNMQQDVDTGVKFGQLALELVSKLDAKAVKPKLFDVLAYFILHRKSHLKETLPLVQQGYTIGLEVGNLEFAAYDVLVFCFNSFLCAQPLATLAQETRAYRSMLIQLKQLTVVNWCSIYLQMILNLLTVRENPTLLSGEFFEETELISELELANDSLNLHGLYLFKLILCFLFEEIELAHDYTIKAKQYLTAYIGSVNEPTFYFYDSLTELAGLSLASYLTADCLQKVEENQTKLQQYWANHAPMNYQHKVDLVEAEKYRVLGQKTEAIELYEKAIAGAKANEYISEVALANELAAKFYLSWGKEKVAASYMTDAYYCYSQWGAAAKVAHLEKYYPQLLQQFIQPNCSKITPEETISSTCIKQFTNTSSSKNSWLDFPAFLKAGQALSKEIQLENLLTTLMQIAITTAGAETGYFILPQEQQWLVVAEANQNQAKVLETLLEEYPELPHSLIYSVARHSKTVVFDNLSIAEQFAGDRYIITHQPQSVLCIPLNHQGKRVGILYLENNLTQGAFTQERVEVLNLLMSQAAISIENARLYQQTENYSQRLEIEVEKKTKDLNQKAQDLEKTLKQLKQTQAQLIHTEKMSSLGQMVAGIAHEINNPISFIKGNLTHTENYIEDLIALLTLYEQEYSNPSDEIKQLREDIDIDFLQEDVAKLINSMKVGSTRISQITQSLRNFSRLDEATIKIVDLHSGIESTLLILQNRLQAGKDQPEIKVIKEYGDLPKISCNPSQLNQVFFNIITNGIDAIRDCSTISKNPEIRIRTEVIDDQQLRITIANSDSLIPREIQERIFDPFFTTKPIGKGTGLGLFVCYSIVKQHGGTLNVRSQPGKGTEFEMILPCHFISETDYRPRLPIS